MLTFQDIYEETQAQVEDDSATSLVLIKRAINVGAKEFGAILGRDWRVSEKTFSTVASQQYYQMPEDAIRIKSIRITIGGTVYLLEEVADEDTWIRLNQTSLTSDIPEYFFIKGEDQFGIYPTPATSTASAGTLSFERRMRDMSQDDYTTGTISLSNGVATASGSGTTFTETMAGRYLKVDDPEADGMWYKIDSYSSATLLQLENIYSGPTVSGKTYRIGEVPDIPEEFHESLIDYACFRYYLRRRDPKTAKEMRSLFIDALGACQANYGSKTTSQYVRPLRPRFGYRHQRRDYTVS